MARIADEPHNHIRHRAQMARQPRLDLPDIPQHIIQRGKNRLPCFLDDDDRLRYLACLRKALQTTECKLHAYVLMDNHVHLLVTPPRIGAVSSLMQKLGRQYVCQFNARHRRTGRLWEGRFKACLVDPNGYLLQCYRYIDLNPVRTGTTDSPETFRWSSCPAHCGADSSVVTPHVTYLALGDNHADRATAYRALLYQPLSEDMLQEIRCYLHQQRAMGTRAFQSTVEAKTRRFVGIRPARRPSSQIVSSA